MLWCNCEFQSKPEQGPKRDSEAHLHVELDEGDGGVRGGAAEGEQRVLPLPGGPDARPWRRPHRVHPHPAVAAHHHPPLRHQRERQLPFPPPAGRRRRRRRRRARRDPAESGRRWRGRARRDPAEADRRAGSRRARERHFGSGVPAPPRRVAHVSRFGNAGVRILLFEYF